MIVPLRKRGAVEQQACLIPTALIGCASRASVLNRAPIGLERSDSPIGQLYGPGYHHIRYVIQLKHESCYNKDSLSATQYIPDIQKLPFSPVTSKNSVVSNHNISYSADHPPIGRLPASSFRYQIRFIRNLRPYRLEKRR